jgi:hypothetical protein
MLKYAKALIPTSATLAPIVIKEMVPHPWSFGVIGAIGVFVYLGALKLFKPDDRFLLVRGPTLDAAFDATFEEQFQSPASSYQPFRVHVLQPRGRWWWRRLEVTYSYNSNNTHADHGRTWRKGRGLCWSAYQAGLPSYCHRNEPKWSMLGLTDDDKRATEHVWAVFAIPLRRPAKSEEEKVSSKVTAILAFDALSPDAASVLEKQFELYRINKNDKMLDRAAYVSLYF